MRSLRTITMAALALTALAAQQRESSNQPDPPDLPGQKKIIDDLIARAHAYEKDMPDFVCSQVTIRNEDPKGTNQWKMLGSTNSELTFIKGKEEYRTLAVNGKKVSADAGKGAELFTPSDFATYIKWTFDKESAGEFSWSNWDALRGHKVHVIGFRVPKEHSKMVVGKGKFEFTSGFLGIINVDVESGAILKLGIVASDVPAGNPVQAYSIELNWDFAKVGDHYYALPYKVDQHSKENKKTLVWNEVEFRDYRKPGADTAKASKAP
jgi:hypothetical protein